MPGDAMPWGMPPGPRSAVADPVKTSGSRCSKYGAAARIAEAVVPPPRGVRTGQGGRDQRVVVRPIVPVWYPSGL